MRWGKLLLLFSQNRQDSHGSKARSSSEPDTPDKKLCGTGVPIRELGFTSYTMPIIRGACCTAPLNLPWLPINSLSWAGLISISVSGNRRRWALYQQVNA